ncbi:Conserved_hypothetical protein [Hexamita inflata]|uniref:Uncharacterized protein n=1 Tax=Hexamita inflata TaxID=28002 RepID=A0AA86UF08_9EUKA|nr:Conserved hypothetical protein [Hexamita inflata]
MLDLVLTLHLNCFAINSSAEYQKQTRQVRFTGSPNLLLTDDELKICQQILNSRTCIASIFIGTQTFQVQNVQFYALKTFYFDVSCKVNNGCQYSDINQYSIATFELNFDDINVILTGVAGKFFVRIFNRLECHSGTIAVFNSHEFDLKLSPVESCLTRPSSDQMKTTVYLNEKQMFSLSEKISDNVDSPSSLSQFIAHVSHLDFDCSTLNNKDKTSCNKVLTQLSQREQQYFDISVSVPIQIRYQKQTVIFNQQVKFSVKIVNHEIPQDCFSRVELTVFDNQMLINAYPGVLTKCSTNYFSQFQFDQMQFSVSIAEFDDYSGFKILASSPIPDYKFGELYTKYITCDELKITNCSDLLQQAQLLPDNATFEVSFKLTRNYNVKYKSTLTPKLIKQDIDTGFIEIHDQFICLNLKSGQASNSTVYDVNIQINAFSKQMVSPLIDRTCTTLTETEQKLLRGFKINQMPKTASVVINSDILPDAQVNIYDVGEKCWIAWVAFVSFSILGVVWLGFIANV